MHVSVLSAVLGLAVPAGWMAAGWYCRQAARRRKRRGAARHAEWTAVAAGLGGLDEDLDRVWAAETKRARRDG